MKPRRFRHVLPILLALACSLLVMGGCQAVGFALAAMPKPDIPAAYEPDDRKTVVLVDDPNNLIPSLQMMGIIAHGVGQELRQKGVITDIVDPRLLEDVRLNHEDFSTWPIDRVGKRVGADQVIYVLVEQFQVLGEDQMYRPVALMRVKLVDAETGDRLFPINDPLGHARLSKLFFKGHQSTGTAGTVQVLERKLAERMGSDVAKLFYKHPPRRIGSGYDD